MKVFKKLAAAGAALMMAVTGMAMNVSADSSTFQSFSLHYYPNVPASANVTTQTIGNNTTNTCYTVLTTGQLTVQNYYTSSNSFTGQKLTTQGYVWSQEFYGWSSTVTYTSTYKDPYQRTSSNPYSFSGRHAKVVETMTYNSSKISNISGQTIAF